MKLKNLSCDLLTLIHLQNYVTTTHFDQSGGPNRTN